MCGIAGIVHLDPALGPVRQEHALQMAGTLSHRGPDAQTAWASPDGRCALGHARLAVIDLATGDQPMADPSGRVRVVFNGEIYNFQELMVELAAEGRPFRTHSDTEVILQGYLHWGDRVVEHLDGMFAFALWDLGERGGDADIATMSHSESNGKTAQRGPRLLLARDRAGKKPIFYQHREGRSGRFIFGSEIKAVLAAPGAEDRMDPSAIPLYLTYGYVPTPGTFYQHIRKLPPAHTLVVEPDGSVHSRRYWQLTFRSGESTKGGALGRGGSRGKEARDRACQRVRELTEAAVQRRLIADVPLGAFLSGGVDSTVLVGIMSRQMSEPVRTFSIGFADDATYDETSYARIAANHFGTKHTEFIVEAQSVDLLDDLIEAYDEPFGDSSAIPTSIVSRLTREHVTVALTGDGGDEVFGGYIRFRAGQIADSVPGWAAVLGNAVGRHLPYNSDFRSLTRRTSRFFAAAALSPEERTLRWIGFFTEGLDELLGPDLEGLVSRSEITASFRDPLARSADQSSLSRLLQLNFDTYLLDDLLVKADRSSMLHGLELRSPFLDTALMEYAASLPDGYRVRGRNLKWILKEAFRELLPETIRTRGKWGFGVPLPTWFRTHWRPLMEERLLGEGSALRPWLEPEPVRRLVLQHLSGEIDHGHQLWALLTLEGWLAGGRYSVG